MKGVNKMIGLLCVSLFFFSGCKKDKEPITGGKSDNSDYNAPKVIKSKNIIDFSTSFFINDKYENGNDGVYTIEIKNNDNNEHILTIKGVYNFETVVDDKVLKDVQAIIDKNDLVKNNGINSITHGLPYEYQPWSMNVVYDSKEKLSFYENAYPNAMWILDFRDYFEKFMIDSGYIEAIPSSEDTTINNFSLTFIVDHYHHEYTFINDVESGEVYLEHFGYNIDNDEDYFEEYASVNDKLYMDLQTIVDKYNLYRFNYYELRGENIGTLEVDIEYVSGRSITCDYDDELLPDLWFDVKDEIKSYLNNYFIEYRVDGI